MEASRSHESAGARFWAAVEAEKPLQVAGAINAYTARLAEATGFRALYLSGGGVAANSLGLPDLGISTMEDVLADVRRIVEAKRGCLWSVDRQVGSVSRQCKSAVTT